MCMLQDNIAPVWGTLDLKSGAVSRRQNRVLKAMIHPQPSGLVQGMMNFHLVAGGGGGNRAPQNWGEGLWEKGSIDREHYFICTRKLLSMWPSQKREIHAYPPCVAGMIQCMVLPRGMCIELQVCSYPCYVVSLRVRARV